MNAVISSPAPPKPIRYIINTSAAPDHTGGNEKLAAAGSGLRGGGFGGAVANVEGAPVDRPRKRAQPDERAGGEAGAHAGGGLADGDLLRRTSTSCPTYFNGEAVIVYHAPAANTDGDSIVFFRRSEVISAGDIFSTVSYPVIDVAKGRQRSRRD